MDFLRKMGTTEMENLRTWPKNDMFFFPIHVFLFGMTDFTFCFGDWRGEIRTRVNSLSIFKMKLNW